MTLRQRVLPILTLAVLLLPAAALAECPVDVEARGDAAMSKARELLAQLPPPQEQTVVVLSEPGTGATATPGAAPEGPRALTPEEQALMEAARPDPGLAPARESGQDSPDGR